MNYPNKIYVSEYKGKNTFEGESHFVVVVASSDMETARKHVKDKIGIDVSPTWLMGGVYPNIYGSDGKQLLDVQAKILYNGSYHNYK